MVSLDTAFCGIEATLRPWSVWRPLLGTCTTTSEQTIGPLDPLMMQGRGHWDALIHHHDYSQQTSAILTPSAAAAKTARAPNYALCGRGAVDSDRWGQPETTSAQEVRGAHCEIVHGSGPLPRPQQGKPHAQGLRSGAKSHWSGVCALCALVLAGKLRAAVPVGSSRDPVWLLGYAGQMGRPRPGRVRPMKL